MPKYLALNRVVLPGGIVEKDATFESDLVPGSQWKPIDKEAKAAVKARNAASEVKLFAGDGKPDPRIAELEALNEALEAEVKDLQAQVDALTAPPEDPSAA